MNAEFDHLPRFRRRSSVFVGTLTKANEKLQTHVKNIDIYGKIHDDYCVKSTSKSIISFLLYVIVLILILNEIRKYYLGEKIDNINVDNNLNNKLDIKMDILFPSLRCEEISLDTVDNVGENQVDAKGELKKIHININGDEVPSPSFEEGNKNVCLSCYGAESNEYKCCNTCDKLKSAYRERGWSYLEIVDKSPQCLDKIGCRIVGKIQVNRVSGNFHVALGTATVKNGKHVHEFNMNDISRGFNTSHVINELTFGTDKIPFVSSPLDKVEKVVKKGTKMFHYYIKLVPTEYIVGDGRESFSGNQYTYSEKEKEVYVSKGELSGLPGVFFVYDFQPFVLKRTHQSIPLTHLVTSFCAIVGGIYSVMSILDSILTWVLRKVKENLILFEHLKIEYSKLALK
ncbi:serologically defined breast cancer antigen 84 [Cryptosporidium xiaoi]|uniref:Serologically defined breast cancer antigen 84 n=1 Tax=Cryptosporidium xiaoi TaxID=659607 RepID=A0AAV9Y1V3_9CRYT